MAGKVLNWQLIVKLALLAFFILRSGHFDSYFQPLMRPIQQYLASNLNKEVVSKLTRSVTTSSGSTSSTLFTGKDEDLIRRQALSLLRQKRQVLHMLTPEHYTQKIPAIFNSSVASHIRHILDHYQTAITAVQVKTIDESTVFHYDERKRDTDIEKNQEAAVAVIEHMEQEILSIDLHQPIKVAFYGDSETFESFHIPTIVGRELSFASHHAIHHLSMVKLIMQELKYTFPTDATIGIAPSTAKDMKSKGLLEN